MHRWLLRTALGMLLGATLCPGAEAARISRAKAARVSRARAAPVAARKASRGGRVRSAQRTRRTARIDRWPPLTLVSVNAPNQPRMTLRLYDRRGRLLPGVLRRVALFLRCHHTGRRHAIAGRLLTELYRVARHFGDRPILFYSGFRDRRVARLKRSYHTRGQALDFRIEGVGNRQLRDFLLASRRRIGVGYYTGSPFVHLDVRERPAFWVDFSGPGEPSRYATDARALLLAERRGVPAHQLEAALRASAAPRPNAAEPDEALEDRTAPADTVLISTAGSPRVDPDRADEAAEAAAPPPPLGPPPLGGGRAAPRSADDQAGAIAAPPPTPVVE